MPVVHEHESFYLTSGTGGLQEAINANGPGSAPNTVILDNAWYVTWRQPFSYPKRERLSNIGLVDITQTPYVWYHWNGAQYVVSPIGGNVLSVFGRTGAVTAQAGDYTCDQITNCWNAPNQGFAANLVAAIAPTDTTFTVTSLNGTPGQEGYLFIDTEWVHYLGVSGNTFTVAPSGRGYFGSTAASHSLGAGVEGAILVAANPGQLPHLAVVGTPSEGGVVVGLNNPFPSPLNGGASIWLGTTAYLDAIGGYHQTANATMD